MKGKLRYSLLLILTLVSLIPVVACSGANAQDIQGLLQAIDGKEVIVTLGDGTTARIRVEDDKLAVKANDLVGKVVDIKMRADDKRMVEVKRLGEDSHFTGNIESIGAEAFVIGGQTFKVNGTTVLDGGLAVGVPARVEAVRLPDGSLLATEIETDNEEGHFAGKIESLGKDAIVIGGKAFSTNAMTRLDSGLANGVVARVEFVTMPNGSMVAIKVETDESEDGHLTGAIGSISPDAVVINGQTIRINGATRFDNGTGLNARVEFIKLADGTLLASKIEFDRIKIEMEKEDLQRREAELRGREQELRGREQELQKREVEIRGREDELRGREQEVRGREDELRGREAEGEGPRGENEARGREAEGEGGQEPGDDNGGGGGGGSGGGSGSSGSGSGGSGS